jgi:hypothetical protein
MMSKAVAGRPRSFEFIPVGAGHRLARYPAEAASIRYHRGSFKKGKNGLTFSANAPINMVTEAIPASSNMQHASQKPQIQKIVKYLCSIGSTQFLFAGQTPILVFTAGSMKQRLIEGGLKFNASNH